jgi:hypothetical protein
MCYWEKQSSQLHRDLYIRQPSINFHFCLFHFSVIHVDTYATHTHSAEITAAAAAAAVQELNGGRSHPNIIIKSILRR